MDTILDMTKSFMSSVCFCLLPTDVAWENIVFFCSCQVIALEYFFGKVVLVGGPAQTLQLFQTLFIAVFCSIIVHLGD